jgi:DNA-binding response OmpR family regulator
LVEDDPAVRSLLEFSLEARGAQVIVAPTAVEFARLAREAAPFDGALVDLSPIAEDVAGALAIMRGSSPNVRIILISGVASGFPDSIASEVSAWVRKPFEMTELIEALESALTSPARPRT